MIIIKITGGLGNQLFQFALGLTLEETFGIKVKYDLMEYKNGGSRKFDLDKFVNGLEIATKEEIEDKYNLYQKAKFQISKLLGFPFGLNGLKYYLETNIHFDQHVFGLDDNVYLSGYWQNENYFIKYRSKILEKIKILESSNTENMNFLKQIQESNSVSLHVRRGDYISNSAVNSIYAICDLSYYERAIKLLSTKFENLTFFVFSDDMDWVKNHFSNFGNMIFVEGNNEDLAYEDLKLMSNCKHNIIANSTFSWWAAWLNQHQDKVVIAPKSWYTRKRHNSVNLVPVDWHRI